MALSADHILAHCSPEGMDVDENASATPRRILCVDDDATMLDLLQRYLECCGFNVLTSTAPREGLAVLASEPVDAVVLDYLMPELDGLYVAGEARRLKPHLPLVMFSGSHPKTSRRITELVDVFVAKAEGVPALVTALETVLAGVQPRCPVRRFRRYAVTIPVVLTVARADQTTVLRGTSTAIGEGGLGCTVDGALKPGDFVWIDFCEPKPLTPLPGALVRYRNGNDYGFEFQHVNAAQQLELRRYCARLACA
jgi:CheY-like chemotaxis protein